MASWEGTSQRGHGYAQGAEMNATQQVQLYDAQKRAATLEHKGHDRESIQHCLRRDGYAEAVVQAVLESVWFHI